MVCRLSCWCDCMRMSRFTVRNCKTTLDVVVGDKRQKILRRQNDKLEAGDGNNAKLAMNAWYGFHQLQTSPFHVFNVRRHVNSKSTEIPSSVCFYQSSITIHVDWRMKVQSKLAMNAWHGLHHLIEK